MWQCSATAIHLTDCDHSVHILTLKGVDKCLHCQDFTPKALQWCRSDIEAAANSRND